MKRIITLFAIVITSVSVARADDRPVTFAQLPAAAQTFINSNFPAEKISYATKDDDILLPDYKVVFVSGLKLQFNYNGAMESIESRAGIPEKFIPTQIKDYVKMHYPDAVFVDYEVGKKSYEVKLSNRLELKFNKNFILIEIDD